MSRRGHFMLLATVLLQPGVDARDVACYTLNAMDSFGDGWEGGAWTWIDDGGIVTTGTVAASSDTASLCPGPGGCGTFYVDAESEYLSEQSWTLSDASDAVLAEGGAGNTYEVCDGVAVLIGDQYSCYEAHVPTFEASDSCAGYESAGYTCVGDWCGYDGTTVGCIEECTSCADRYPDKCFNAATARCVDCKSLEPRNIITYGIALATLVTCTEPNIAFPIFYNPKKHIVFCPNWSGYW